MASNRSQRLFPVPSSLLHHQRLQSSTPSKPLLPTYHYRMDPHHSLHRLLHHLGWLPLLLGSHPQPLTLTLRHSVVCLWPHDDKDYPCSFDPSTISDVYGSAATSCGRSFCRWHRAESNSQKQSLPWHAAGNTRPRTRIHVDISCLCTLRVQQMGGSRDWQHMQVS